MDESGIHDYLAILKRRRLPFFVTFFAVLTLSVIFTSLWSSYRSTAMVQIQQPDIPESVATPSGVPSASQIQALADQRINQIQQRITSTAALVDIITKFDLYPSARRSKPMTEIVEAMGKKIKLEMVSADMANPAAAQRLQSGQLAAIAFTVSFDYADPLKTQLTVSDLIGRFLDEDAKQRREQAAETSAFLARQVTELDAKMLVQEKAISDFRAAHAENRPEALALNQQNAANIAISIQSVETRIAEIERTRGDIMAQLAVVDPYSRVIADGQILTTPAIQLKALQAKYSTSLGQYGEFHPDVIKLRRQIEGLRSQMGQSPETADLNAQIIDTQTGLAAAETTLGPDHPDVRAYQRRKAELETRLAVASREPLRHETLKADADNPAYLMLVAQSNSARNQHAALLVQRTTLERQLAKLRQAIAETPAVEQQYAALARDYDNSQLRYRELNAKKMAADMSATVEQNGKSERLVLLNPAELPTDTRPKRSLLLAAGLFLSLVAGIVMIGLTESLSRSVHGTSHLAALTGVAPLVTISHIFTHDEQAAARRHQVLVAGLVSGGLVLAAVLINALVIPLDVVWSTVLRKFGLG
ncbi:GumC family protein [Magnetospirillum fulvum]|uniref:Lipopolysaccharide biosynthesis protein n=1 Tax=Magnetospirillum fulvum MGU-K5 TaxID=1316936 RepID=S9SAZ0_MAGFU|nr:LPS biosynthesis protein [Magnetospirillum fulvum]EPY01233.1 lipopolysaccharide biosynthesis protein [Magnetospirillum fulvum MGU-K5]